MKNTQNHLWMLYSIVALAGLIFMGQARAVNDTFISSTIVLKVADKDFAGKDLIKMARAKGGYFTTLTNDMLRLRIPVAKTDAFLAEIEKQGMVVERKYSADYLGDDLMRKESSLKVKEKIRDEYLKVLQNAESDAVLEVENEMVRLLGEIETLKGSIKYIKYQLQFSEVQVQFKFQRRNAPQASGKSSFGWLNTMNLSDLIEDF